MDEQAGALDLEAIRARLGGYGKPGHIHTGMADVADVVELLVEVERLRAELAAALEQRAYYFERHWR